MYYIRNEGYVGNALIWWGVDGKGYTTDIRQAGKFTLERALNICKRPQDSAYEVEYIDNLLSAQKLIIDCQYVDSDKRFSHERLKLHAVVVTDSVNVSPAPKQQCYKGNGECDCPGLCRENC